MSTLRRRIVGLAALLLIVGIIVGLPLVLLAVGANPLEASLPSFSDITSALTSPDDGSLLVGIIEVVAWAAWAFLTLSLLVEIVSRARGIRAPRMTGLRMPQNAARGLVGAAVMLFVSVPVANAMPAAASSAVTLEPTHVATITAPANPADAAPAPALEAPASAAVEQVPEQGPVTVQYTVKLHESLWSIAASQLGDGHRFTEIVDLNQELLGGKANFIRPGWVLQIPAPPEAPAPASAETVTVERGDTLSSIARDELGDADRYPEIFDASRDIEQPGGAHLSDPSLIQPGWTLAVPHEAAAAPDAAPDVALEADAAQAAPAEAVPAPELEASQQEVAPPVAVKTAAPVPQQQTAPAERPAAPTASANVEHGPAADQEASESDDGLGEGEVWQVATAAGIGTVLAAGVLAVVARRRRTQQRLRRPGQSMPLPLGETATFEQEIRAAADPLSVETVDLALRSLAQHCAQAGAPLPTVRAARLTADRFELYLETDAHLPAPWVDTAEAKIWTLEVTDANELAPISPESVPAPYPSLVTIGHDDEAGHVFLNLEHLGALGITGDDPATREILAALAIELATSVWADDLQVTLVGAFPELEDALQTGRIRYLPSVGRLVDELATRAQDDRQALAAAGAPDLYTARVTGAVPDAWDPEIVLLGGNITDRQRGQLAELVAELPHVAMATVTSGASVGEWSLETTSGSAHAVLSPIGLQLQPQRLPMEQYGHLLQLVALTDVDELDGAVQADPSVAEVEAITPVDEQPRQASAMPAITLEMLEEPAHASIDPTLTSPATIPATTLDMDETTPAVEAIDDHGDAGELEISTTHDDPATAHDDEVPLLPALACPRVLMLGPVDLTGAAGSVEDSKRARLLEYAAYLALNPRATHTAIDDAIWPDRRTEDNLNTRNTATSKLRRWVGQDENGNDYLPRHQAGGGYGFVAAVTTDIADWDQLLGGDPLAASTEHLEAALHLVRGIPFEGTHRKRYAWAEPVKQRLISEIVDASYSLAKRRLMEGRWRAAEAAVVVGLSIEPAQENLWRVRILAAHESRNPALEAEAIERFLTIPEQLECDLEPETEQLLAALKNPGADFDRLMAHAL